MFLNERLLDCDGWGSSVTVTFNTTITERKNKVEDRNQEWEYPLRIFTVEYEMLNAQQQDNVYGAFLVAKGQRHTFRYKDWTNFKCDSSVDAAIGTNTYQMGNSYTFGTITALDPITLPVDGTVQVFDPTGTQLIEGVGYDVNYNLGTLTLINVAATGKYTYKCEYDRKVRFRSDEMQIASITWLDKGLIDETIATSSVFELIEVRADDPD